MLVSQEDELSRTRGAGSRDVTEGHLVTHKGVVSMILGLAEIGKALTLGNII